MRRCRRVIALVSAILLLPLLCLASFAEETEVGGSVVFVNRRIDVKGLVVTKQVVCENAADTAPKDATFTFQLKVNDKEAARTVYRYFNAQGQEVLSYYNLQTKQYTDMTQGEFETLTVEQQSNYAPVDRKTDDEGRFSLTAGASAIFTELNNSDRYYITELRSEPSGFILSSPAEGVYTVTPGLSAEEVQKQNTVTVKNIYRSTVPPPPGTKTTTMQITKRLQFPTDYAAPETNAEFRFTVTIDEQPWAGKKYAVFALDPEGGATWLDDRVTDDDGVLVLSGDQQAVLEEIPVDRIYTVTETETEGWWSVGERSSSDVTTNDRIYLDFTNRNVSFGVQKLVEGECDPEQEFTFLLTDGSNTPCANTPYLLYDGAVMAQESSYTTDSYGQFKLKADQTAFFTGIREGSVYSVCELPTDGFEQVFPLTQAGYENQTVGSTIVIHKFSNAPSKPTGYLSVGKTVVSESGDPVPMCTFRFRIVRVEVDENEVETEQIMANAVYTVDDDSFATDADGAFTLTANQTAVFRLLPLGERYRVYEDLGALGEYSEDFFPKEGIVQTGDLEADGLTFRFTNVYRSFLDLQIIKTDDVDTAKRLPGATFLLEKLDADGNVDVGFGAQEISTDASGECMARGLVTGRYRLTETESALLYELPKQPVELELSVSERWVRILSEDAPATAEIVEENGVSLIRFTMTNHATKDYELPSSGGIGTTVFYIIGGVLVVAAGVVLITKKRVSDER